MDDVKMLVAGAQQGDLKAFGRLVRRFQNMVYGYAYGILGDFHLAEDVSQEAFLEAYYKLPDLKNAEAFSAWMRTIVFKYCDRLTRRKQLDVVGIDVVPDLASDDPNPDVLVEEEYLKKQVAKCVESLPQKERVVTSLFYMNMHSLKDVAVFLEVPVSTVKNRLHSARQLMKERMADVMDEGLKAFKLPERFAEVMVQMQFVLGKINPLEKRMQAFNDVQMIVKSDELRLHLKHGGDRDDVKAEAFALVKEASRRVLGRAHYDVQLVAGLMMDAGWVVEAVSGEGKSLACLLTAYLAVLEGKRVHIVTLSDELARRDSIDAAKVFGLLNIEVGLVVAGADNRDAYACSIIYGAYTTFAFDGLRDHLCKPDERPIQLAHDFAIVDEADRVLIHESRTPIVIAQNQVVDGDWYRKADDLACQLIAKRGDSKMFFERDQQHAYCINLTSAGVNAIGLDQESDATLIKQVIQALRAHVLYQRNHAYVVKDGCVVVLDGESGRLTPGRRFSEGLHQALEIKENVMVRPETLEEGRLLVQDYFRMYSKLAGVTGTAQRYEDEFRVRYGLPTGVVPTRLPLNRVDYDDRIYRDAEARDLALVDVVRKYHVDKKPVLIGVRSLEDLKRIAELFETHKVDCQVFNTLQDNQAHVIAQAGEAGVVTVTTQMGGRGTEVSLSEEALESGGLHVIGYGRHDVRTFDEQLQACAGRQGQPGSCQFFLCQNDKLVQDAWQYLTQKDHQVLHNTGFVENKRVTDAVAAVQAQNAHNGFKIRQELDVIDPS